MFFFLHIPKTAGTSFYSSLKTQYQSSEIFPNDQVFIENGGQYPPILKYYNTKKVNWNKIELVFGHYTYGIAAKFSKAKCLTFLRNPIERTVSNIQHIQVHREGWQNKSPYQMFHDKNLLKNQFSNIQTKYLLNNETHSISKLTYDDLQTAKNNILQLDFVGITERYSDSIDLFNRKFNYNLDKSVMLNKNENNVNFKFDISKELIYQIVEHNYYDIELYNFAMNHLDSQL